MPKGIIITEDIFGKAARRYCERRGLDPQEMCNFRTREDVLREQMERICEKILALYDVGALPKM